MTGYNKNRCRLGVLEVFGEEVFLEVMVEMDASAVLGSGSSLHHH